MGWNLERPGNSFVRQNLLWSRVTLCSSSFVESDPTTAQDFESCAVVGSDSAKLDEQGGHIVVQFVSLRAIPGAGFRHFSPLPVESPILYEGEVIRALAVHAQNL